MTSTSVIVGDCIEVMRGMGAGSVQCCVTSPPYWGLRDYGTAEWEGGDGKCEHRVREKVSDASSTLGGHSRTQSHQQEGFKVMCPRCGARRIDQQLGLEPTPEAYLAKMVEVFREVKRLLRDDGCMLLNCGDSYAGGSTGGMSVATEPVYAENGQKQPSGWSNRQQRGQLDTTAPGLKPKNLCMMPSRLALALQADGWYLRSMMPWVKRSAMPEPATDRPTSALEYVFLLTKKSRYFWDADAVRVKQTACNTQWQLSESKKQAGKGDGRSGGCYKIGGQRYLHSTGRNFRNTDLFYESLKQPHGMIFAGDEPVALDVNPEAFRQAHFATFPRKLVTPLIKAGTSERGCCPECGCPWERVVEKEVSPDGSRPHGVHYDTDRGDSKTLDKQVTATKTLGWEPGCGCKSPDAPIPCTVLDIFLGSGTTLLVAKQLGRNGIGIELNASYAEMARRRIANPEPEPEVVDVPGQMELFDANE